MTSGGLAGLDTFRPGDSHGFQTRCAGLPFAGRFSSNVDATRVSQALTGRWLCAVDVATRGARPFRQAHAGSALAADGTWWYAIAASTPATKTWFGP